MSAQLETPVEGELIAAARTAIADFDPFQTELAEFQKRYDNVVYDLDDAEQSKQARSDRHAIGKVVARLDRQHQSVKGPLLEVTRLLDGRRKAIKDGLLEVQGRIKSQLEAHEAKEKSRVDAHYENIQTIRVSLDLPPDVTVVDLRQALVDVERVVIDDTWEEFKADALLAKTETVEALMARIIKRENYEAGQAELARLRAEKEDRERAERELKIAADAATKAKREAEEAAGNARLEAERVALMEKERAEKYSHEAEKKAAREIAEANARAQRAAVEERERILREQKESERKAAAERAADEKRTANKAHRDGVDDEATAALILELGITGRTASQIVAAVRAGKIEHMEIVY